MPAMDSQKLSHITEADIAFSSDHLLGQGSFAVCHRCWLKSDQCRQEFVLKELRSDAAGCFNSINRSWLQKRLIREVTVMHSLACEREDFVKVLHLYIKNGCFCGYTMELCHNGSLRSFTQRIRSMDPPQYVPFLTARWMLQVSGAFDYLQSRESGPVLHRDLAVDNVLVTDTLDVKIADFGLTKALSDSVATTNTREFDSRRGIERQLPETFDDIFREVDKFGDRYLYGICVVEAFAAVSLRGKIENRRKEFKTRVKSGLHLDDFESLMDRECFDCCMLNDGSDEADHVMSLQQLRSTAKQVVRMTAHQLPKQRVTFAEVSDLWRLCDRDRMEAERLRVLTALTEDAKTKLEDYVEAESITDDAVEIRNMTAGLKKAAIFEGPDVERSLREAVLSSPQADASIFETANVASLGGSKVSTAGEADAEGLAASRDNIESVKDVSSAAEDTSADVSSLAANQVSVLPHNAVALRPVLWSNGIAVTVFSIGAANLVFNLRTPVSFPVRFFAVFISVAWTSLVLNKDLKTARCRDMRWSCWKSLCPMYLATLLIETNVYNSSQGIITSITYGVSVYTTIYHTFQSATTLGAKVSVTMIVTVFILIVGYASVLYIALLLFAIFVFGVIYTDASEAVDLFFVQSSAS